MKSEIIDGELMMVNLNFLPLSSASAFALLLVGYRVSPHFFILTGPHVHTTAVYKLTLPGAFYAKIEG